MALLNPAADPSTPSIAAKALELEWAKIRAIRSGVAAIHEGGQTYLPKYAAEDKANYDRRLVSAPWRPEFEDAIRSISAKPFGKEVVLQGEPSAQMRALAEDIDGRGNNLHVFARDAFEGGVALGAHGILVDYPTMQPKTDLATERALGVRPYWVSVDADSILAIRTQRVGAREIVTHLRILESAVVVDGFAEALVRRIRLFEPGRWQVWREHVAAPGVAAFGGWRLEAEGDLTLPEIPFVFFATGERRGPQYVRPPLADLAEMQVELYRALSRQEEILTFAGSPMLQGEGVAAPLEPIHVGPKTVLYTLESGRQVTGANPRWSYVQPAADNIREIREHIGSIIEDMRRLGLQPMLPKTGGITATATGTEAAKAHTAVQSWAMGLKDALEQAFVFTGQWLGTKEAPEVSVHTDFAVGLYGAEEVKELREARKAGDLSQRSYWDELSRRGVLGPSFDPEEELDRLAEEAPVEDDEETLTAAFGAMPAGGPPTGGMPGLKREASQP